MNDYGYDPDNELDFEEDFEYDLIAFDVDSYGVPETDVFDGL